MTAMNRKSTATKTKVAGSVGGFDLDQRARQNPCKCKRCDETNRNPQHAKVESLSYHQTEAARRRRAALVLGHSRCFLVFPLILRLRSMTA
jgi:hypothetical protein